MIKYHSHTCFLQKVLQCRGSVFPQALAVAIPCAAINFVLRALINAGHLQQINERDSIIVNNAAWGGFTFAVGFLIVFRTSQSYNRFWDGCTSTHRMRAEWFEAACSLVAFCKNSKAEPKRVAEFQNILVRLTSMLHAAALAEIEDSNTPNSTDPQINAFKFDLLDAVGMDSDTMMAVRDSHAKVELITQWIQQLIVDNINSGVLTVPPPILSRSFQELSNGIVAFHDAMKISFIPFPFPYAQICDFLLVLHWCVAPFVLAHWVTHPFWGFVFTFGQEFVVWALNFTAVQLENPFGSDANDIDGAEMQMEMNEHLLLLVGSTARRMPALAEKAMDLTRSTYEEVRAQSTCFHDVWVDMEPHRIDSTVARRFIVAHPVRRRLRIRGRQNKATIDTVQALKEAGQRFEKGDEPAGPVGAQMKSAGVHAPAGAAVPPQMSTVHGDNSPRSSHGSDLGVALEFQEPLPDLNASQFQVGHAASSHEDRRYQVGLSSGQEQVAERRSGHQARESHSHSLARKVKEVGRGKHQVCERKHSMV